MFLKTEVHLSFLSKTAALEKKKTKRDSSLKMAVSPQKIGETKYLKLLWHVSLFNIDQIPEKEVSSSLQCKICKGMMREMPKSFTTKLLGVFISDVKNTRRYECEECKKELYIRER